MAHSAVSSAYFRVRGETSDGRLRIGWFFLNRLSSKAHLVPNKRVSELRACNRSTFDRLRTNGYSANTQASQAPITYFAIFQNPLQSNYD